jgi:16S rRNA (guanine527-N7)-methyltransferase
VVECITKYFTSLSGVQIDNFSRLKNIYEEWNTRVNLISRKDFDNFYIHHVLHSLAIAKIIQFNPGTKILDVGTGGGFPGIPLAIMFTDSVFSLLDSIEKKTKVVFAVASELGLSNVNVIRRKKKTNMILLSAGL